MAQTLQQLKAMGLPEPFAEELYASAASILQERQASAAEPVDESLRARVSGLEAKVAEMLEVAPMRVYEVATFYTMFNRERVGKYFIQLCGTTPCMACGAGEIRSTIEEHLGISNNETTEDGLFTLREVECLGACSNAPMVQLNDDFYENLTPETTIALLEACKNGTPPPLTKWGSLPMNGQLSCEGPQGKTTLDNPPHKPGFGMRKDFDEKANAIEPSEVKDHMMY